MNDKSKEYLEVLLHNHNYHDLSASDKLWVDETIGGESAYKSLKALFKQIAQEKEMEVSTDIKNDLIRKMKTGHQPVWTKVVYFKVPAYAAVLILAFFIGLFYLLGPKQQIITEKQIFVTSEPIIDTLIVKTDPDTIYINKVKMVKVPVYIQPKEQEKILVSNKNKPTLKGKTLADQEEIRSLLISSD